MACEFNIVKKSPEAEFASFHAMARQLKNGISAEKEIPLERWKLLEAQRQTTLDKGTAKLTQMTQAGESVAKISLAFFGEMNSIEKTLKEKKPLSEDDCRELNIAARDLRIRLDNKTDPVSPAEYTLYASQVKEWQTRSCKVYPAGTEHWELELVYKDQLKRINESLERIYPQNKFTDFTEQKVLKNNK